MYGQDFTLTVKVVDASDNNPLDGVTILLDPCNCGGITNTNDIKKHLDKCDGVMIGRAIYQNPYFLNDIEREIFKNNDVLSREEIVKKLLIYLEEEVKKGTKVNHIMRHTVGLYHGQPGSKEWKRYLSDNMMARDSDFQKAKHIMDIAQNNEKANQLSA